MLGAQNRAKLLENLLIGRRKHKDLLYVANKRIRISRGFREKRNLTDVRIVFLNWTYFLASNILVNWVKIISHVFISLDDDEVKYNFKSQLTDENTDFYCLRLVITPTLLFFQLFDSSKVTLLLDKNALIF